MSPGAEDALPQEGDVVAGKLRIQERLGAGGIGIVVAATHLQLRQRVAIKFLRPEAMSAVDGVARFLREAQAAAQIENEHCVRIMDVGTLGSGVPYIVMECLRGHDLRVHMRDHGPMEPGAAVDCVMQACEAIAEAHERGIVHRDLKPANLFLCRRADGARHVKVLDFGIAKILPEEHEPDDAPGLTGESTTLGTSSYMAPEQLRDASRVDARTDVWALGVMLFELVSGERPFEGKGPSGVAAAIVADPAKRLRDVAPDAPVELEAIVARCLQKEPARRFASVLELSQALAPMRDTATAPSSEPVSEPAVAIVARDDNTHVEATTEVSGKTRRPRRGVALLAGAALVVAAGVTLVLHKTPSPASIAAYVPPASAAVPTIPSPSSAPSPSAEVSPPITSPPPAPSPSAAPPPAALAVTSIPPISKRAVTSPVAPSAAPSAKPKNAAFDDPSLRNRE